MPMWMWYPSKVRVPFITTNIFTASEILRHCIAFLQRPEPGKLCLPPSSPLPPLITPAPNAYALAAKRPPRPSARHRSFGEQPTAAPHFFLNHRGHDGTAAVCARSPTPPRRDVANFTIAQTVSRRARLDSRRARRAIRVQSEIGRAEQHYSGGDYAMRGRAERDIQI